MISGSNGRGGRKKPSGSLLVERHQNVKSARADASNAADNDTRAGTPQIIPIAVEDGIAQEANSGLEAHLHKGADGALEAGATEGRKAAALGHKVGDEVEVAVVNADAVAFEDGVHFSHDGRPARFHAVKGEHGMDVVGEDLVRVEDRLISVHGAQVDA